MSLHRVLTRPHRARKLVGAFFAIMALTIQPLVSLNIPSAFAATTTDTIINEAFTGFTGSNAPTTDWSVSNLESYASDSSCGVEKNCVKFNHTKNASTTLTLPLTSQQTAAELSFYLAQQKAGNDSTTALTVEQFKNSISLGSETYTTTASDIALNPATTKIVFKAPMNDGNNLAFDDVKVTATTTTDTTAPATPTASPSGGSFSSAQTVSLSSSDNSGDYSIYYTTNGDAPTSASTKYTTPIAINSTTTLKAIAIDAASTPNQSAVMSETYTFAPPADPAPAPTPVPTKPATNGTTIFDSTPTLMVSSLPSQGYEATQTAALGDKVKFAGSARNLNQAQVILTSWACQTGSWNEGNCKTTPGASFNHPITLSIYKVAADGGVGEQIDSKTQTFAIPYRPSAHPDCSNGRWKDTNGGCFNGYNHAVTFDMSGVTVPGSVIYSVAYNTTHYGANPIGGTTGPYDSLNFGLSSGASTGTDVNPEEVYWDHAGSGLVADSSDWAGYVPAVKFTADAPTPPSEQTYTVTPSSSQGWTAVDDNGNGGSQSYVSGPATPPIGSGSAQLEVKTPNQGYLFAKSAYGGTKLADIVKLGYSTYVQTGNNTVAPSIQVNVTPNVNGSAAWYGRLVYEPYMNGNVTDGQWQTWNAAVGKWWLSKPSAFDGNCAQANPCTFDQLVDLYPNVGINTGSFAGIGFKAGSSWTNFKGNVDAFRIATASINDGYNFEPEPADTTPPAQVTGLALYDSTGKDNDGYTKDYNITIKWDGVADAATYEYCYWNDVATSPYREANCYTAYPTDNQQPGVINQGEGMHHVKVRAIDAAGNKGEWSQTLDFVYDKTDPVAGITGASQSNPNKIVFDGYVNDENFSYYYCWLTKAGDSTELVGTRGDNCVTTWAKDQQRNGNPATSTNQGEGSATDPARLGDFDISGQPSGDYTIHLIAKDRASNTSSETTYTLTVDRTAPAAPNNLRWVVGSAAVACGGTTNQNRTAPTWDSVNDATSYRYQYMAPGAGWADGGTYQQTTTEPTAFGSDAGDEGEWQFRVASVDAVGNQSDWSAGCAITFDKTAPNANAGSDQTVVKKKVNLSGTSNDPSATYAWTKTSGPGKATFTAASNSSTSVKVAKYGSYVFTLTVTDQAGNQAQDNVTVLFKKPAASTTNNGNGTSGTTSGGQSANNTGSSLGGTTTSQNNTVTTSTQPTTAIVGQVANGSATAASTGQSSAASSTNKSSKKAVLGETTANQNDGDVLAATDTAGDCFRLFGACWYWWVPVVVTVAGIAWLIMVTAARRRSEAVVSGFGDDDLPPRRQ